MHHVSELHFYFAYLMHQVSVLHVYFDYFIHLVLQLHFYFAYLIQLVSELLFCIASFQMLHMTAHSSCLHWRHQLNCFDHDVKNQMHLVSELHFYFACLMHLVSELLLYFAYLMHQISVLHTRADHVAPVRSSSQMLQQTVR